MSSAGVSIGMVGIAALGAGFLNAVAGGGTLLTFSALWSVLPSVSANATSTVALLPGALSGAWGFREELQAVAPRLAQLAVPSVLGGAVGALLVTRLDPRNFVSLIPWLVALSALLLFAQPKVSSYWKRRQPSEPGKACARSHKAVVILGQFVIGIYGGYFGAGVSILLLGALGFLGLASFHEANAVKTVINFFINATAAVLFAVTGHVDWRYASGMALLTMAGGYLGARLSRQVNPVRVRQATTVFGLVLAAYYFCRG